MKFSALPLVLLFGCQVLFGQDVKPLAQAHAHNDYEHKRPLLDALDQGFCSVEADVFAIDGELRVGHYRIQTKPGRTLEKLYLEPLRKRAQKNDGRIYKGGPNFTLLIDFKTKAEPTYELLKPLLKEYRKLLVSKNKRTKTLLTVPQFVLSSAAIGHLTSSKKKRNRSVASMVVYQISIRKWPPS